MMVDEAERPQNSFVAKPSQRKTLLSPAEEAALLAAAFTEQPERHLLKRKVLLSRPELARPPNIPIRNGPAAAVINDSKRRALLPGCPSQMSNMIQTDVHYGQSPAVSASLPDSTVCNNGIRSYANAAPQSNRRVLLSFSGAKPTPVMSQAQPAPAESTSNGANGNETKKTVDKSSMTEGMLGSGEFVSSVDDLAVLHHHRLLIDRRIAELQANREEMTARKDMVTYISGYYCHPCRKFVPGEYEAKVAHCGSNEHVFNTVECGTDPEMVFKYYEREYDGIAFDDDNDNTAPSASPSDKPITQPSSVASCAVENGVKSGVESGDDEEDEEDGRTRERFDRTRISRK